jgi:hypothetical protein
MLNEDLKLVPPLGNGSI